jgi:hypothetical protein
MYLKHKVEKKCLERDALFYVLVTHVKISCVRNRLIASLSTSCNNVVILSSCYKVVTHNLLTNC